MAAGDVVNIDMDGLTSFQPAAGVELFVLKTFRNQTALTTVGFQNGVTTSWTYNTSAVASSNRTADWNRFAINNTEYYYQLTGTVGTGFSAIQIK